MLSESGVDLSRECRKKERKEGGKRTGSEE